ncbi:MAG: KUP/HAK/KT family potassium transporter [Candidatus Saccharimonadales bacterium]
MGNTKKGLGILLVGALGVVFGDIGTSPLYVLSAIFGTSGHKLAVNQTNVYGVISAIAWAVILIVCVKYVGFIMRADNKGEGGIIALTALIKSSKMRPRATLIFVFLGLIGVALFYGDSAITPAISVLSAVEGVGIIEPHLKSLVVPLTLLIICGLFWIQHRGTNVLGRLFGPIMLVWFTVIALGGTVQVCNHPQILTALSPKSAIDFFAAQPLVAFVTMSAVMLAVTGVEALYADMGHFGRKPISRAWFFVVFPALLLCYLGQGALLLHNPETANNPFYLLYPESMRLTILIIATAATLIASQSVISGAFSLTRQAVHLGFLPKMIIKHTSMREIGQVYLPFVNITLFIIVCLLVVFFGTSQKLAGAYGMAVSITLLIDTILFAVVVRLLWRRSLLYAVSVFVMFAIVDVLFVSANLTKLLHGGWFPLALAALVLVFITTWIKGQRIIAGKRIAQQEPLQEFVEEVHAKRMIRRIPGAAVYIGHSEMAPLALRETVEKLRELHKKVLVVSVSITNASHIPEHERIQVNSLKYDDGISYVDIHYGYHDSPNIPKALADIESTNDELRFNPETLEYFISQTKLVQTRRKNMAGWRKAIYMLMDRNELSASDYYKLPTDRTIEMRTLIEL